MKLRALIFTLSLFSVLLLPAQELDMDVLHGLKPRSIGPAGASGRVTALDVELKNPNNIYMGSAAGGLWKSGNGGSTWDVIFDDGKSASIGSIAIDQNNPNVIWVGTGEGNPRNSMNNGAGMYKTIDGGHTWQFLGLDKTNGIHRIILHPDNPNVAVVAATGTPWGENPERGIYKTADGGKSWQKTLYVDEKTGAADLVVDPSNPNKLIAAMWEHRRWPWFFESGGPGSGIFVSFDGGDTWTKRTSEDGLPKGDLGRIGLAIAPSDPDRVYAYVESKSNAVFRSDDGGFTWKQASRAKDGGIGGRPFYYADIYVDPKNENRIYSIHSTVTSSEDGGKTWQTFVAGNKVHTDHHAWWIHPDDPNFILNGHDGGLTITHDRGKNWHFVESLPLTQFYHVRVDDEIPYNVYGGSQDNGSWRGPSQTWFKGGIRNFYWQRLSVGDGFDMVPDPQDNRYGWSMGQGGGLNYYDRVSGLLYKVQPTHPDGVPLRFNWNAGIGIDPHDKSVAYYGSQFLHKTSDQGQTWEVISPDLTTNNPKKQDGKTGGLTYDATQAENHTTIISIAPSPVKAGIIWVGTDDGNVQVTRDGGKTWSNTVRNMKGLPANSWAAQVQPSTYNEGEAFATFDNHRTNDWTPYVYHTKNFGRTWTRLVDDTHMRGATLSFLQDTKVSELMFTGTEFGLWVSVDAGKTWTQWTNGYGSLPTQDMVIQERENDLVIATFGRSFYILDDIEPLRALAKSDKVLDESVHVFDAPNAYQAILGESIGYRFGKVGDALYEGENRPYGALITYYLKEADKEAKALKDRVKIEISNARGQVVRTLYRQPKAGINRFNWRMERDGVRNPARSKPSSPGAPSGGMAVLPGMHTIRVTYQGNSSEASLPVLKDPRLEVSQEEMVAKNNMIERFMTLQAKVTDLADALREAKANVVMVNKRVKDQDKIKDPELSKKGKNMLEKLDEHYYTILSKPVQGIYRDPNVITNSMFGAMSKLQSVQVPVSANQETALNQFEAKVKALEDAVNKTMNTDYKAYLAYVKGSGLSLVDDY